MNDLNNINRERADRARPWSITAAIFLLLAGIATVRIYAANPRPSTGADLNAASLKQSGGKTNPDCLDVSPIVLHGSTGNSENVIFNGFANELDAVIAAMNEYNPLSIRNDREYIGVILQHCDRYYYTAASGRSGRGEASMKVQRWVLQRSKALWHTHGSPSSERKYFSDTDTRLANSLGKRFYLGDAMGNLRVFKPGDTMDSVFLPKTMGLPNRGGFAAGEVLVDENGHAIRVANEHPIKPLGIKNSDSEIKITCIRKST